MPSLSSMLAFAVASAVIVAIPGPSLLFTIGRALSAGRRDALLTVAGNALGISLQVVGLAVGLGPVIAASAMAYTLLKVAGGLYLVWLGVQALRRRRERAHALASALPSAAPSLHALRTGVLVGLSNPKSLVLLAAVLPQFVDPSGPVGLQLLVLGPIFALVALLGDGSVALLASRFRDWFAHSPRRMERVGGAGGVMMIGLGAGVLLTGRPD